MKNRISVFKNLYMREGKKWMIIHTLGYHWITDGNILMRVDSWEDFVSKINPYKKYNVKLPEVIEQESNYELVDGCWYKEETNKGVDMVRSVGGRACDTQNLDTSLPSIKMCNLIWELHDDEGKPVSQSLPLCEVLMESERMYFDKEYSPLLLYSTDKTYYIGVEDKYRPVYIFDDEDMYSDSFIGAVMPIKIGDAGEIVYS